MKSIRIIFLVAMTCTALLGCVPIRQKSWSCISESLENGLLKSQVTATHIQIDGTPSMQGFVRNPSSVYIRTLRIIDSAMGTAFPRTPNPNYYQFGTERLPRPDMTSPKAAERIDFYSGKRQELLDAEIDKIIDPIDSDISDDLYVIVTDLYQKDAQWQKLSAKLKDLYILKDYAVGILAVRSDFSGRVFDVGLKNRTYERQNGEHPFYVIVLGAYNNVQKYFDAVKASSVSEDMKYSEENFVIFSTKLLNKHITLNIQGKTPILADQYDTTGEQDTNKLEKKYPLSALYGITRPLIINDGQIIVTADKNSLSNIERLKFSKVLPENLQLRYELQIDPLPYTLQISPPLRTKVKESSAFSQGGKRLISFSEGGFTNPIILSNWHYLGKKKIGFDAEFVLEDRGVYQLAIDILPSTMLSDSSPSYTSPPWWQTWSFGEDDYELSKTYNLKPFLNDLAVKTFRIIEDKPDAFLGRLCFLVQVNH